MAFLKASAMAGTFPAVAIAVFAMTAEAPISMASQEMCIRDRKYGTYEMNGIAFEDVNEIWWLETIGGHHWIARKVPDEVYVVMPNQLGMDEFDLEDALGEQKNYIDVYKRQGKSGGLYSKK